MWVNYYSVVEDAKQVHHVGNGARAKLSTQVSSTSLSSKATRCIFDGHGGHEAGAVENSHRGGERVGLCSGRRQRSQQSAGARDGYAMLDTIVAMAGRSTRAILSFCCCFVLAIARDSRINNSWYYFTLPAEKRSAKTDIGIQHCRCWHRIFDRQWVKYPIGYMTGQILSWVKFPAIWQVTRQTSGPQKATALNSLSRYVGGLVAQRLGRWIPRKVHGSMPSRCTTK